MHPFLFGGFPNTTLRKYRMDHEKVARLPFCACPCDILCGVSIYILRRVFEHSVNS